MSHTAGELWSRLEASLAHDHAGVTRIGHGALEVVDEEGEIVTIHVTPQQWRAVVARCEEGDGDGATIAYATLDEQIASRRDDEQHVVFLDGRFHRSAVPPDRADGHP